MKLASDYLNLLDGVGDLQLPFTPTQAGHVYHLFVIRTSKRNELRDFLRVREIETAIHYPIPPHLQKCFSDQGFKKGDFPITEAIADTALSLPLWPGMEAGELEYVCDAIKDFF